MTVVAEEPVKLTVDVEAVKVPVLTNGVVPPERVQIFEAASSV